VARLNKEGAQRQYEDGSRHQQDAETQFLGKAATNATHGRPPFLPHCLRH